MSKEAGPNPTDRGRSDVKRSVLCDAAGIPLAVVIDGANRHDVKLFEPTFCAIVVEWPRPKRGQAQGVCLDKGYDSRSVRELLKDLGFETYIRSRGEEASDLKKKSGHQGASLGG